MDKVDITIVGAGVIGLAIAAELSREHNDILVIEKNPSFGQETSSRNSEVIHAGLYYPKDSLKAKLCLDGRERLYEFCREHNIKHKKIGKLVVAVDKSETADLEKLFKRAKDNGVDDLRFLSPLEIKQFEPQISAIAAIFSPSTGILDTHAFMERLLLQFKSRNGMILFNDTVKGATRAKNGFEISVEDKIDGETHFYTRLLINAAGLNSDSIAAMAGINDAGYSLKYCKGDYFRVQAAKAKLINHLVYPVHCENHPGLGIHATLDLAGGLRLGPDTEYVDKIDYQVSEQKKSAFYADTKKFLPFLSEDDLTPDTSGIRPKLQGPGEGFRDFIIREESDKDLPGLINLVGIESPGLTSALAIANMVKEMAGNAA